MFGSEPVERSSSAKTSQPSSSRSSARCDPMKPAPPVMRALGKCRSLPGGSEQSRDVRRARIERERPPQLASRVGLTVRMEVGEREGVVKLYLPRLLPHGLLERWD